MSESRELHIPVKVALAIIAGDRCENFTSGPGSCWATERSPLAKYTAFRWCDACIALAALKDSDNDDA